MCPKYGDPQRSTAAIILDTKTGNYQEYDDGLKGGVEWWSWGWGGGLEGVMISILKTHQTFYSQSKSIKMLYICFSRSVWNLGVIFYDRLSMKQQVSKICQSAYPELRRISSIRHVLTVAATKTHVTSLVLSCLDYCNSLLSGIPQQLIDKLQKVQNCSAPLIFKTSKCIHFTTFG